MGHRSKTREEELGRERRQSSKSGEVHPSCRFESDLRHQPLIADALSVRIVYPTKLRLFQAYSGLPISRNFWYRLRFSSSGARGRSSSNAPTICLRTRFAAPS